MAGPASTASSNKRQKSSESGNQPPNGNFPPQGAPYGQYPPQGPYNGPPGGQQFPMQPQPGYNNNMWQPGQQQPPYGGQVPWQSGQQGMFRQSPPLGPPNGGPMPGNNWGGGGGYRGQPPPNQSGGGQSQGRRGGKGSSKKSKKNSPGSGNAPSGGGGGGGPYQQGWQQQQQFPMQNQWGGGGPPPQMWQSGPGGPPRHGPQPSPPPGPIQGQPMVPVNQNAWPGGGRQSASPPPRSSKKGRPRSSPEPLMGPGLLQGGMMPGLPSDVLCTPIGLDTDLFMSSTASVGTGPDDENTRKPSGGSSVASREKGRGSYRCGRCGAPKKGHVCPYQPKLKRRPDEPPPQTRNAAVQVEMDEFMTLRRLNLEIQGFPESYATASHMIESRVFGEPSQYPLGGDGNVMSHMGYMGNDPMTTMGQLSVPTHVASQPTPMKTDAPKGDAPQEDKTSATATTTTTEQMADTTPPVDEVPVEKEKVAAV